MALPLLHMQHQPHPTPGTPTSASACPSPLPALPFFLPSCRQLNDAVSACQRILDGKVQPTDVSILRQHGQAATLTAEGLKKAVAATTGVDDISPAGDTTATSVQLMDASQPRYVINVASCAVGALSAARAGSLKQFGTLCYPLGGALTLMKWKGCSIQVCTCICTHNPGSSPISN